MNRTPTNPKNTQKQNIYRKKLLVLMNRKM
jgi:hypothetical protein